MHAKISKQLVSNQMLWLVGNDITVNQTDGWWRDVSHCTMYIVSSSVSPSVKGYIDKPLLKTWAFLNLVWLSNCHFRNKKKLGTSLSRSHLWDRYCGQHAILFLVFCCFPSDNPTSHFKVRYASDFFPFLNWQICLLFFISNWKLVNGKIK